MSLARRQKKTPNLDRQHHVVRKVNKQQIILDPSTKEVLGISPTAMELKTDRRERYLSTNHLEWRDGDECSRLTEIVEILSKKGVQMPSGAGLAKMNVGEILDAGANSGRELRVVPRSNGEDPCYAAITGLPYDNSDLDLLGQLAERAVVEIFMAGNLNSAVVPKV